MRKVYNLALQAQTVAWSERHERVNYAATGAMLTVWKKSEELAFLNEVSCVPLQQCQRHPQGGFTAFFEKRAGFPRFKSKRRSKASAEFTASAFRWRDGELTLAKMTTPLQVVWSRPVPQDGAPYARTADRRRDHLHQLTTRLVRETQTLVIEDLPVRNMVKNHRLARSISDAAWSLLRELLTYKCAWYGRNLIVIDRWYPSSKLCSHCGHL
ncbi:RNA-guided endonuclease InsQ/TnpB family protein, partial [Actinoplanes derwentensis]